MKTASSCPYSESGWLVQRVVDGVCFTLVVRLIKSAFLPCYYSRATVASVGDPQFSNQMLRGL